MNNFLQITGIYIPGEVAFNKQLNSTDMLIWWIIYSLAKNEQGICWASNEFFAKKLNIHKITVSNSLQKLKTLGYIFCKGKCKRKLQINYGFYKKYSYLVDKYNLKDVVNGNSVFSENAKKKEAVFSENAKLNLAKTLTNNNNDNRTVFSNEKTQKSFAGAKDDKLSSITKKVVTLWNKKGSPFVKCRINTKHPTQKLIKINKIILTFLQTRKYNSEQIYNAINNYFEIANTPFTKIQVEKYNHFPKDLLSFFESTYKKELQETYKIEALFYDAVKGKNFLENKYKFNFKNAYPKTTKLFKKLWKEYLIQWQSRSIEHEEKFTSEDDLKINKSVKLFIEFCKNNKLKFTKKELLIIFFKQFLNNRTDIKLYYLCNQNIYKKDFYYWLQENNYLNKNQNEIEYE